MIFKNKKFRCVSITSLIILLIPILFYLSVTVSFWSENYFWVERNNATMPVWVRGNIDSGVFFIFIHGGPGSCGTLESIIEVSPANGQLDHVSPLKIFEKDYAMVYWDQRHSGMSKGSADPNDTRPEDYGEDLAIVVKELKKRYEIDKIFLFGQSWGYFVAACYMAWVDNWQENQSNIAGFIGYKGNHEQEAAFNAVRPRMIDFAQLQIQKNVDTTYWQEVLKFYSQTEKITNAIQWGNHYSYIHRAMGGGHSFFDRVISSTKASFLSNFNGLPFYFNFRKTQQAEKLYEWIISDQRMRDVIHRIAVPTLLIYGRKDLIAPWEVGQSIYNDIGTDSMHKELLILDNSRHGAENSDVIIFQNSIKNFIEKYK